MIQESQQLNLSALLEGDSYRVLIDKVLPDALFIHDHDGWLVDVNTQACLSVGYSRSELLTMNVMDLEVDFDLQSAQAAWSAFDANSTATLSGHHRRKDGSVFPVEVKFGIVETGSRRLYFGTVRDVSDREITEAQLRATIQQLQTTFEAMAEGLVVHVPDGRIIDANSAAETILGLSHDQLLGKTSMDPNWRSVNEDGRPLPGDEHPAMVSLRTGLPVRNFVMGIHDPITGLRWISINSQPILDVATAKATSVVATFVDITAQRHLTEELRMARTDLQAILDNVPARITSWFADYTNRFVNQMAADQFGISAGAAVGKPAWEVIGEQRFLRAKPFIDAALAGEQSSHEQVVQRSDGSIGYSHVTYVPKFRNGIVVGVYTLATDITELRESYLRVRELAQRLETVREKERRSTAHVLHEGIAQDLFAMQLSLGQLKLEAKGRAGVIKACEELGAALERCMGSIRQIANELQPEFLAHLRIADALTIHSRYFSDLSGLKISVTEPESFPALNEQLRLIFFRTAQEALTNVAKHAKATCVDISLHVDAEFVGMDIVDDGTGIADNALSKVGSLGLLGIRERFEALGGNSTVLKNAGAGTTLSVRVPLTHA